MFSRAAHCTFKHWIQEKKSVFRQSNSVTTFILDFHPQFVTKVMRYLHLKIQMLIQGAKAAMSLETNSDRESSCRQKMKCLQIIFVFSEIRITVESVVVHSKYTNKLANEKNFTLVAFTVCSVYNT